MQVCTTPNLDRPSVIGFFAPRILIPEWLLTRLTPGELRQIVLHETEHLRRGDDWTNLFQKLCLVLFPLDPALVWIERRLCAEREMACDDGVVRVTHAPRAYAACLASLAERGLRRRAEALSLGAWQRRPELAAPSTQHPAPQSCVEPHGHTRPLRSAELRTHRWLGGACALPPACRLRPGAASPGSAGALALGRRRTWSMPPISRFTNSALFAHLPQKTSEHLCQP